MRINKKGQSVTGQIFVYILAVILFGVVILMGYKAVNNFVGQADKASLAMLKNELESEIETISISHDIRKKEFSVPTKYQQVCFINLERKFTDLSPSDTFCDDYPLICDVWEDAYNSVDVTKPHVEKNIFLIPDTEFNIYAGNIKLRNATNGDVNYLCIPTYGKLILRLEGTGKYTQISKWNIN